MCHAYICSSGCTAPLLLNVSRLQLKCDGTRWRRARNWRGNRPMEWVASTLHTTSEHGVSSITTADAHISAASNRVNWRPPADLNGLVRFAEKRNLVSARVCHHISTGLYYLEVKDQLHTPADFLSRNGRWFSVSVLFGFQNWSEYTRIEKNVLTLTGFHWLSIGHAACSLQPSRNTDDIISVHMK